MKRFLFWSFFATVVVALGAFAWGFQQLGMQGLMPEDYADYKDAEIIFDKRGIPTITADGWEGVIEAQGFVVASERLFQMDLIRRQAGGRLAEWFGPLAFEHDVEKQTEDRVGVIDSAYKTLPDEERKSCDSYARGVNRFIEQYTGRWGIEYRLLNKEPEPWSCTDSLLVLLQMSETLTASADREAKSGRWREYIPEDWWNFIFTLDHPWNRPYFGPRVPRYPKLPNSENFLPLKPLSIEDEPVDKTADTSNFERVPAIGSNNWAYRGKNGAFLANDPHLGQNVPTIWYAVRLRISADQWVVGASLPGLPGVILGMNPHLAWAFTNTGEDVDDYLRETLSDDGSSYLAKREGGEDIWMPVLEKTFAISVKDEQRPREVVGRFTHRGPMATRDHLEGEYSRQWAPLKPGVLRLPITNLMTASTIDDAFAAIDGMRTPAQNILIMNRAGRMAYRVSGVGVKRRVSGLWPQDALDGEWLEIAPSDDRRFMVIDENDGDHRYLATANERIWIDAFGHSWFGDGRKERVVSYLESRDDYVAEDMVRLHNDTESRFRREFLRWIVQTAGEVAEDLSGTAKRWQEWDGNSRTDPLIFRQAEVAEDLLLHIVFNRLRKSYGQDAPSGLKFNPNMERAWLITLMSMEDGFRIFGLDDRELAQHLLATAVATPIEPHHVKNKWAAQHPFVAKVPMLGTLFRVKEVAQYGHWDLVNAESPLFGPSTRLVWNMSDPAESTWAFPIGQSGHLRSAHYRDLQSDWEAGKPHKVFDSKDGWGF